MGIKAQKATYEFRAKPPSFYYAGIAQSFVSLIRTIPSVQEFHLALKQIMSLYFPFGKTHANYYIPPKRVCK